MSVEIRFDVTFVAAVYLRRDGTRGRTPWSTDRLMAFYHAAENGNKLLYLITARRHPPPRKYHAEVTNLGLFPPGVDI